MPDAKPVEVMRILPSDWEVWKSCYGQARAAQTTDVTSFLRETVEAVHVNIGDKVKAGQLLLTLRNADQAAGERAGAAAYAEAKLTHERLRALYEKGGVSRAEVDKAYAAMKSEEAKSQSYRSTLTQTRVLSKIAGVVTARHVEPGEIAEIGQTLLSVEDSSDMEAWLMVSARDIGKIDTNTPVRIIAGGAAHEEKTHEGKVKRVNSKAQAGSGLCPVIVAIAPEAGVLPGTYVEGSILVHRKAGAIVIPSSAVVDRGGKRFVYTAHSVSGDAEKIARLTRIETGDGRNGKVLVTAGLQSGDLLIVSGSRGLSDGVSVSYAPLGEEPPRGKPSPGEPSPGGI
jgi:membrane fusion protein (multidrug efflux system)